MKVFKSVAISLIIVTLLSVVVFAATKSTKKPAPKPKPAVTTNVEWAAKVNGDRISMEWYMRAWEASKKEMLTQVSDEAENAPIFTSAKKNLLEQMIEAVILLQWADKEGIVIKETSIVSKIAEIKRSFPSVKDFQRSLKDQGMSLADLERDVKKQLIIDRMITIREKNLAVSDEEMLAFFNKNIELYGQKEKLHVRQIKAKTVEEVLKLKAMAVDGDMNVTEDLGFVEKGSLPIDDDSELYNLEIGQMSGAISCESGCYVYIIEEKQPGKGSKYDEVKGNIRKFLLKEKARGAFLKDLQDEKANSKITINEKLTRLFE